MIARARCCWRSASAARRRDARRRAADAAARAEGFGFLLVVLPAPGLRALAGRAAAGQRDDGRVGRLHAAGHGTGAAGRAAGDRGDRLARLVVGRWRRCRPRWRCVLARAPCRRDAPPAVGRSAVARTWLARLRLTLAAPGPWLVAMCVRDVFGAVAGGDRLPAVDLRRRAASPAPRPACSRRASRPSTWSATSPPAGCCSAASRRPACCGSASRRWRWPRLAALRRQRRRRPAAGAALRARSCCSRASAGSSRHAVLAGGAARAERRHVVETVGWVQQWSALGQFAGPPLVAALASSRGGGSGPGRSRAPVRSSGSCSRSLLSRQPLQR